METVHRNVAPAFSPIQARRGRRRLSERFAAPRREGSYCIPLRIGDELKAALAEYGNRDAAWRLGVFLAMTQCRRGGAFVVDRRALNRLLALRLTEDQVRGALATLAKAGFLRRAGGGGFDRERRVNRAALYAFAPHFAELFAGRRERQQRRICKSPTAGLRPIEERSGGLGELRLSRLAGFIPNGGTARAQRAEAIAALERLETVRRRTVVLSPTALSAIMRGGRT